MRKTVLLATLLLGSIFLTSHAEAAKCSKRCKRVSGNGVCNEVCNTEACKWDGGDCLEYEYWAPDNGGPTPTAPPTKKPTSGSSPTQPPSAPTTSGGGGGVDTTRYNIEVLHVGNPSTAVRAAFEKARKRWEGVITNDIKSTYTYKKGTKCFGEAKTLLSQDKVVDDLLIFADITPIDGAGNILGSAGPCFVSTTGGLYSRVGYMQFDSADMSMMASDGTLDSTILHEMGHILGIGTLWEDYNLVQKVSKSVAYFKGANGATGLSQIGGTGKPMIETDGGGGTAYGHWDETTYRSELMTGWSDTSAAMSAMTVQSLKDMGFTVNAAAADAFTVPKNGRLLRGGKKGGARHHLGDDRIHKKPEYHESDPY